MATILNLLKNRNSIYGILIIVVLFSVYSLYSTLKTIVKWSPTILLLFFIYQFYHKMTEDNEKQKMKKKS